MIIHRFFCRSEHIVILVDIIPKSADIEGLLDLRNVELTNLMTREFVERLGVRDTRIHINLVHRPYRCPGNRLPDYTVAILIAQEESLSYTSKRCVENITTILHALGLTTGYQALVMCQFLPFSWVFVENGKLTATSPDFD